MSRTVTGSQVQSRLSLIMVGGFMVLLTIAAAAFIDLDTQGVRGAAIGAGLGLVNLAVGYLVTRRSLRHGMKSAMGTLAGGFLGRLFVVAGLMVVFRRSGSVDPAAFGLTFLVFFFGYLALEMLLVERSLAGARGETARGGTVQGAA